MTTMIFLSKMNYFCGRSRGRIGGQIEKIVVRWKRSFGHQLKIDEGEWSTNEESLQNMARLFYVELHSTESTFLCSPTNLTFPIILPK